MGLVTLSETKSYLGITVTTYDSFLNTQINIVSETVKAFCKRNFLPTNYIHTFYKEDLKNSVNKALLGQFPVITVTSVEYDDGSGTLQTLPATAYRIHKPTGILTLLEDNLSIEKLVVDFNAGYETIPAPLKAAIFNVIGGLYNKKSSGVALDFGSDVQRISIPGTISVDFDYSLANNEFNTAFGSILGNQMNVIAYYRSDRAVVGSGNLVSIEGEEGE